MQRWAIGARVRRDSCARKHGRLGEPERSTATVLDSTLPSAAQNGNGSSAPDKLAKAEMSGKAKDVGIGAGMFGGAGYVAYLASLALMLCIIFALAEGDAGVAFGVDRRGRARSGRRCARSEGQEEDRQAGPPIPEQTVESVKQTIETVKEEAKWGLGQTR